MGKNIYFDKSGLVLSEQGGSFFENNVKIEEQDDKGESRCITEDEFENLLRRETTRFVDRSFEHIVLLVGAGASVVTNDEGKIDPHFGKIVAMLAQDVFDDLKDSKYSFQNIKEAVDVFTLEEMSKSIGYAEDVVIDGKLNGKVFNLEDFLSRLITFIQFVQKDKEKWDNSRRAIFDVIKKGTSYDYDASVFKHMALIKILSKKLANEDKLSVITTNYDTLLEDAAENLRYTVFDGFSFSRTPQFDDDIFEWHLSKHVSGVKTRENIYKQQVIDLLKIHGSLTWRRDSSGRNVIRTNKYAEGDPVMIFPSSDKYMQSYEEPYFELFSRFQELLKRPNTLLVTTGFSFADNHISRMIIQAIRHNASLYSLISDFDINPSNPNENWKELVGMKNDTYPIVFLKATLNDKLTTYFGEKHDESR